MDIGSIPSENATDRGRFSEYQIGSYSIDTKQRALFRDGRQVRIPRKTFELLLYLVQNSNRIVNKHEILQNVWGEAFVEESNISVHVSNLRKIFGSGKDGTVEIETLPKSGYRLNASVRNRPTPVPAVRSESLEAAPETTFTVPRAAPKRNRLFMIMAGLAGMVIGAGVSGWWFSDPGLKYNPVDEKSYKGNPCPPGTYSPVPKVGRCEDPIAEFSEVNNPNGNWLYGFTPLNNSSHFTLFEYVHRGTHPTSPETPVNVWHRVDEFQPQIVQNPTRMDVVIQGGIVLPPTMFDMHPGPDGQRSTVRWTAPEKGNYRLQGQFRGINFSGYTNSDAMVVHNAETTYFAERIIGFNFEKPFDLLISAEKGDTIDFSVGFGAKWYVGDSTGFSANITTISLE